MWQEGSYLEYSEGSGIYRYEPIENGVRFTKRSADNPDEVVYSDDIIIGERTQEFADIGTHFYWLFFLKAEILDLQGY